MDHRTKAESNNNSVNALLLLFIFDKMDVPITENTLTEMITNTQWIPYMDYRQALGLLIGKNWIAKSDRSVPDSDAYWTLTVDGRVCLSHLYYTVPSTLRACVIDYINANRMHYRRKQERGSTYTQNEDGTYNVLLRIADATRVTFELTLCVPDRATAVAISRRWEERAPDVYEVVFTKLTEP